MVPATINRDTISIMNKIRLDSIFLRTCTYEKLKTY
jgi:hypothetical protein